MSLVATGPAGSESMIAVCETGAASQFAQGVDLSQTLFPRIGDAVSVSRDLAVVINQPQARATQATIGFFVVQ